MDTSARLPFAIPPTARQRPRPDAEIAFGGEVSLDHLVGATEERDRNGEAQRAGRREVDDQLDFGGLLDGQVGGLLALENSARVVADQTVSVRIAASIAHQASGCSKCMKLENRGNRVVQRQFGELL